MKWMFVGLFVAVLMIGAGFLLSDSSDSNDTASAEALKLCQLGSDQVQAYKFADGATTLEAAMELDPNLAEAAISLSFAYYQMGRGDDFKKTLALADSLTAALVDEDRRMIAQLRLASSANKASQFGTMLDSLMTRLQKEQPNNIHVMVSAAKHTSENGDLDQEVQAWTSILEVNPNYADSYNRLGYLELGRGNYSRAIEHMKKYAFLAPDLANPHDSLGDVFMVMGRYDEADQEFRTSIAIQPDFHASYINLGRTYLYRGMITSGVDIMNKVRVMVEGTSLSKKLDEELLRIYMQMDVKSELEQLSRSYMELYPDSGDAAYMRAIRYAYMDKLDEGQALIDSCMTHWRTQEWYHVSSKARHNIDQSEKRYEALVADIIGNPATRVLKWNSLLATVEPRTPDYVLWPYRIQLSRALLDNNELHECRNQLGPILEVNNRLIPALVLAVETDLALRDASGARQALEQLKRSIQHSDEDFVGRAQTAALESLVLELEGHS